MSKTNRRAFLQNSAAAVAAGWFGSVATESRASKSEEAKAIPPLEDPATNVRYPKFRLGLITYNVAMSWDVPTIVKVCKATGIGPVELRTTHKHGVEPSLSKEQRNAVRKQFDDGGVQIWGAGTVCEFQSSDSNVVQKNIESCKQFIDLIADLGGKGVKVRPNGFPKGAQVDKTLEQIGKSLAICGKAAADKGLEIFLEMHGSGTSHPPHMKTVMEHCGEPNVGLTWNSNSTDIKNGSIAEYFHLVRPWIKSCHINELWKDGAGTYPYRDLFRLFRETQYDRVTLCEVATSMPDAASGEAFLRHYRALWEVLANG